MEKNKKFQRKKVGEPGYLNENCWLVKTLNYTPYKRCQYCELKFRNCLFLHYQIISLILIIFFLTLSFLIEGKSSTLVIISVFTLVIVYGYFLNKSTEKIIKAYFLQKKAKQALEELTKNLEEQVEQRTKELKEAYKKIQSLLEMKSEFLRIVNHQLRTPTSIIKGIASILLEEVPKEEKEDYLKKLYSSSETLSIILDDILVAQELVGGPPAVNFSPSQMEKIVKETIDSFQRQAEIKGLKISFEKKSSLPVVLVDQEKIKKSLSRLIDNAILYTEKGEIKVSLDLKKKEGRNFIEIEISDQGIGLDENDKKNLFQIFSRGKLATKLHPNGSGLGLFIVSKYVKAHQGKIKAKSEGREKGSTFIITLPIITEV